MLFCAICVFIIFVFPPLQYKYTALSEPPPPADVPQGGQHGAHPPLLQQGLHLRQPAALPHGGVSLAGDSQSYIFLLGTAKVIFSCWGQPKLYFLAGDSQSYIFLLGTVKVMLSCWGQSKLCFLAGDSQSYAFLLGTVKVMLSCWGQPKLCFLAGDSQSYAFLLGTLKVIFSCWGQSKL